MRRTFGRVYVRLLGVRMLRTRAAQTQHTQTDWLTGSAFSSGDDIRLQESDATNHPRPQSLSSVLCRCVCVCVYVCSPTAASQSSIRPLGQDNCLLLFAASQNSNGSTLKFTFVRLCVHNLFAVQAGRPQKNGGRCAFCFGKVVCGRRRYIDVIYKLNK